MTTFTNCHQVDINMSNHINNVTNGNSYLMPYRRNKTLGVNILYFVGHSVNVLYNRVLMNDCLTGFVIPNRLSALPLQLM